MPSSNRLTRWSIAIALLALLAGTTSALAGPPSRLPNEDVDRSEAEARTFGTQIAEGALQAELNRGSNWQTFNARNGEWKASWNATTRTPHRAFGPPIALAGFRNDADGVDNAVRRFISDNPSLFGGSPELVRIDIRFVNNLWYARYRQAVRGVQILDSDWEFRVNAQGKLAMFGADARQIPANLSVTPLLPSAVAREAGKAGFEFNASTDVTAGGESLWLLPTVAEDGTETLRLVTHTYVDTRAPRGRWLQFVDAQNGEMVWRRDQKRRLVSGTVKSNVHLTTPLGPTTLVNVPWEYQDIGTTRVYSNGIGYYEGMPSGFPTTVTTKQSGPSIYVERWDATPPATFSQGNVVNGATINVTWSNSNSRQSERDVFFHCNLIYQQLKTIQPSWTFSDTPLQALVDEDSGDECFADYIKPTIAPPLPQYISFYPAGPTCPNTGTMPDIIWHEYYHATNHDLYFALGLPFGLTNEPMDEGTADAFSGLYADDPVIGNEFFGPGTHLRDLINSWRWPEDRTGNTHYIGLILGGAIWDMRLSVGQAKAESLMHFCRYGTPDDPDNGVAFNEYFLEVLLADDNDGNLSNGTPHFTGIVNAFNLHGIGTNYYLTVAHTPMADQNTNGPFLVSATLQYTGPIGSFSSAALFYSVNNTPFASVPMLPGANPDEYVAEVPQQAYGIVRYYMTFTDEYGGTATIPPGAPARAVDLFIVGPSTVLLNYDMENAPPGWAAGVASDNATSGRWVRGNPWGTISQPEDDHSPFGTLCYMTGNDSTSGAPPGMADVDDGETTLLTAAMNAAPPGTLHPIITYWRWYTNNSGDAPGEDYWKVDITNNSTNWATVEYTNASNFGWVRRAFRIEDYVVPNTQIKMRFLASDVNDPSLVEALVDDFQLITYSIPADVPDGGVRTPFELAAAWPNPTSGRSTVRYGLPSKGKVSLAVFDLQGREVVSLADGEQDAGQHTITWNGHDALGKKVASGLYFMRLRHGANEQTQRIVISQ